MAQSAKRLCFDLTDAFASDAHLTPHFLEGVCLSIQQAVAQLQNTNFAWR